MQAEEINHRFTYHASPDLSAAVLHEQLRDEICGVAIRFNEALPEGREKSLAITKLEEAMFWMSAAITRDVFDV